MSKKYVPKKIKLSHEVLQENTEEYLDLVSNKIMELVDHIKYLNNFSSLLLNMITATNKVLTEKGIISSEEYLRKLKQLKSETQILVDKQQKEDSIFYSYNIGEIIEDLYDNKGFEGFNDDEIAEA